LSGASAIPQVAEGRVPHRVNLAFARLVKHRAVGHGHDARHPDDHEGQSVELSPSTIVRGSSEGSFRQSSFHKHIDRKRIATLEALGYRHQNGDWLPPAALSLPLSPEADAMVR
jgi:hypothetical protein